MRSRDDIHDLVAQTANPETDYQALGFLDRDQYVNLLTDMFYWMSQINLGDQKFNFKAFDCLLAHMMHQIFMSMKRANFTPQRVQAMAMTLMSTVTEEMTEIFPATAAKPGLH